MSVPFWVHCNSCSESFNKNLKLFMLNCSHTVCKNCLRGQTEATLTCPICKKSVKQSDVTKMPEFFNPRVENTLEKQLQQMTFQRSQQDFLFKQMQSSKVKNNKAMQAKTILEAEIVQLRDQAKKMEERRKLMQKKLLQIHQKNQQRSSSTSAQSVPDVSSGSGERSTSFFDKEGPMFSQHNRKNLKNDSNSKPNPVISPLFSAGIKGTKGSQNNRKPFFA